MLKDIVGELVLVHIGDYWMSHVTVSRGVLGNYEFYCNINADQKE